MPITIKDNSDVYGYVVYECVGIIDFKLLAKTLDEGAYSKWISKYHPKNFPGSYILKTLAQKEHASDLGVYAFLVPTENENKNWKPQGTTFGADTNYKIKKLPIIMSNSRILKWQNSLPDNILTPKYFREASSMDELREYTNKLYR